MSFLTLFKIVWRETKLFYYNVELEVIFGKGMPHIWPILPVMKEAKKAFSEIVLRIKDFENINKS